MMDARVTKSDNLGGLDAEFQALAGEAAVVDASLNPAQPEQTAQAAQQKAQVLVSEVQELTVILQMAASLFFPLFPSLQKIYTKETCSGLAGAIVPVMVKRGWSVSGVMAGWGEEVALAIVVIPLGMATVGAVKQDMAEAEAKAKAEKEKAPIPQAPEPKIQLDDEPRFETPG